MNEPHDPCVRCGEVYLDPLFRRPQAHQRCAACGWPVCQKTACGDWDIDFDGHGVVTCAGGCPEKHSVECECDGCMVVSRCNDATCTNLAVRRVGGRWFCFNHAEEELWEESDRGR